MSVFERGLTLDNGPGGIQKVFEHKPQRMEKVGKLEVERTQ